MKSKVAGRGCGQGDGAGDAAEGDCEGSSGSEDGDEDGVDDDDDGSKEGALRPGVGTNGGMGRDHGQAGSRGGCRADSGAGDEQQRQRADGDIRAGARELDVALKQRQQHPAEQPRLPPPQPRPMPGVSFADLAPVKAPFAQPILMPSPGAAAAAVVTVSVAAATDVDDAAAAPAAVATAAAIKCPHCGVAVLSNKHLAKHLSSCEEVRIACAHGCGVLVRRCDRVAHHLQCFDLTAAATKGPWQLQPAQTPAALPVVFRVPLMQHARTRPAAGPLGRSPVPPSADRSAAPNAGGVSLSYRPILQPRQRR